MVERYQPPLHRRSRDELQHVVEMPPHALGREPHDPDILLTQPGGPSPVVRDPVRMLMTLSVHRDRQPDLGAVEVQYVGTDRVLASEFQTLKLAAS
jgi:hypothetical protein